MEVLLAIRSSCPTLYNTPTGVLNIVIDYMRCNILMIEENSLGTYDMLSQRYTSQSIDTDLKLDVIGAYLISGRIYVLQPHHEGSVIGLSMDITGGDVKSHDVVIKRIQMGIVLFDECLYFVGGLIGNSRALPSRQCERYDPRSKKLTTRGLLDSTRYSDPSFVSHGRTIPAKPIISAVHERMIYVFGGSGNFTGTGEVYSPSKNTWKSIPTPFSAIPSAAVTVKDNIFIFSESDYRIHCYKPDTGIWTIHNTRCILPGLRYVHYNDGMMYLIGNEDQKEIPDFDGNNHATCRVETPTTFPLGSHIVTQE